MSILPPALENLIEAFNILPGVGLKTAERYAYYLVRRPESSSIKLSNAIANLAKQIKFCPITFAIIDADEKYSSLYTDISRNKKTIAVVAEPFDIIAIENTQKYSGTYHVLGGLVSPLDGIGPENLHINELIDRIKNDSVDEIILATSASVEGESTALYIQKQVLDKFPEIIVTRLARGLPIGLDIEYADQITLARALENRQAF